MTRQKMCRNVPCNFVNEHSRLCCSAPPEPTENHILTMQINTRSIANANQKCLTIEIVAIVCNLAAALNSVINK